MASNESSVPMATPVNTVPPGAAVQPKRTGPVVPPGFKVVKVRMPDGTIKKVKRKMEPAEIEAQAAAAANNQSSATPVVASGTPQVPGQSPITTIPPTIAGLKAAETVRKTDALNTTMQGSTKTDAPKSSSPAQDTTLAKGAQKTSPEVRPKIPQHASSGSRRFFGNAASRTAMVFAPELFGGFDEMRSGDEPLSDDDYGYDSDDSDLDSVGRESDNNSINEKSTGNDGTPTTQEGHGNASQTATNITKGLATLPSAHAADPTNKTAVPKAKALKEVKIDSPENSKSANVTPKVTEETPYSDGPNNIPLRNDDLEKGDLSKKYTHWSQYIIWSLMLIFPLLFIILGVLTACLGKKSQTSSYAKSVKRTIDIAISVWPIIFAAILAQSLRAYATYKVERGIRMFHLEQFLNSSSLAASVKQPFMLRRFNIITIALLILWALSPLAGQALVHLLSDDTATTVIATPDIYYLDIANGTNYQFAVDDSNWERDDDTAYFQASLLPASPYSQPNSDPWGNPLIPYLGGLAGKPAYDGNGWWDASSVYANISDYSSLFGIPIKTFTGSESGVYNLTMTTMYMDFVCQPWTTASLNDIKAATNMTLYNTYNPDDSLMYVGMIAQTELSVPGTFVLAERTYDVNGMETYAYAHCSTNQTFVESNAFCTFQVSVINEDDDTVVDGADYSNSTDVSSNSTAVSTSSTDASTNITDTFSNTEASTTNSNCYISRMRPATGYQLTQMGVFSQAFANVSVGLTERWLKDPQNIALGAKTTDLTHVPIELFAARLGSLVNTLFQLGFATAIRSSGFPAVSTDQSYTTLVDKDATLTTSYGIYRVNHGWLAVLFVSSFILLLAGITSIIFDSLTIVPDILGFASSVARRSKHLDIDPIKSSMGGAERARRLGEHRVMMQDVRPSAPVGRIAMGTASDKAVRLQVGRVYK